MKIGIDYRPALLNRTGIGRYTRELVRQLARLPEGPELLLFGHSWKKPLFSTVDLGIERGRAKLCRRRIPSRAIRLFHKLGRVGIESFLGPIDLFHYTDFVHPPLRKTPFVSTLHDAAFLEEGFFPPKTASALKARAAWAVERSQLLLAPSSFTAGELVMRLGAKPGRVVVTPLGADHIAPPSSPPPPDPKGPYVLTVGTIEPRKNHPRILAALETLVRKGFPHRWVVAGAKGWLDQPFWERLAKSPARNRVEVRTDCPESDLPALYAGADLLVYPSLYEGFGLPPLEAMRCGAPVLASSLSSLPEICGDAAMYVDPRSEVSIAEGMHKAIEDRALRERLRETGLRQSERFRWAETAAATAAAYAAALRGAEKELRRLF